MNHSTVSRALLSGSLVEHVRHGRGRERRASWWLACNVSPDRRLSPLCSGLQAKAVKGLALITPSRPQRCDVLYFYSCAVQVPLRWCWHVGWSCAA